MATEKKKEKKYYGINVNKINAAVTTGTWDRTCNGKPVTVACLTSIDGDPEEHYRKIYLITVSKIIGELKDAIVLIDQPPRAK